MMKYSKKEISVAAGILVAGICIGWIIFGGNADTSKTPPARQTEEKVKQTWTCSMHPQIKRDKPGKCPICGMTLIPLDNGSSDAAADRPDRIEMTPSAMAIADVETAVIEKTAPYKEIYFQGKIKPDERLIISQTAHIPGRIEKMYVNFTGEAVYKGQKLVSIYSPELITAQKEFLEALKSKDTYPTLYRSAYDKLRYWKLTDEQIETIARQGSIKSNFDLLADYNGIVTKRMIALGDHVMEGSVLFHITDLSHVWVMFDAYEEDIPWVKIGDKISFTVKSLPGRTFSSTVSFIDPVVNPNTRVAYVRTELDNPGNLLKPEMFTNGILKTMLPGKDEAVVVPKSAVLWTGKRAIVYVKIPSDNKTVFEFREIVLGVNAGPYYVVEDGLEAGEEVAVNGVFKIDAAAQLQGKKSMMNPEGGKVATGHHHGNMPGMNKDKKQGDSEDHNQMKKMDDMGSVPVEFKRQLGHVIKAYLLLKDALAADDHAGAGKASVKLEPLLKTPDMKLLKGAMHMAWMKALPLLQKDVENLKKSENIESKRGIFSSLSNHLINAIQVLGMQLPEKKALYLEYCPMANDNAGAYWLSTEKEIRNPYLGAKMLKCGSVKNTFK